MNKLFLLASLFVAAVSANAQSQWLTSLPEAVKQAQAENKAILVNFTGSDWCGWCIRLKKEVFDEADFAKFANQNLVLVEVDFPRRKQLSAEQKAANEKLSQEYRVEGFPTIFILDKNGKRLAKTGYQKGGAQNYISHLMKVRGIDWKSAAASASPGNSAQSVQPAPIRYDDLVLKGITGGAKKMALINNHTFAQGEVAPVKLGDKQIKLFCKEIRENSVVVQLEGKSESFELKLGEKGGAKKVAR